MEPAPLTTTEPDETAHHRAVLNDFVDLGHELAQLAVADARAKLIPVATASTAFDLATRSARRSILLIHEILKPAKIRIAARKQIIREVEDSIQRSADGRAAKSLHGEMLDRLDTLDLDDELGARPVDEIIADIIRDLGLAAGPGHQPWKRRTPADIAALHTRAAAPTRPWTQNSRPAPGATLHPFAQASPAPRVDAAPPPL
jgi:hypothetical protein